MARTVHYLPSRADARDRAKIAGERGTPVYGRRPPPMPSAQARADQAKIAGERGLSYPVATRQQSIAGADYIARLAEGARPPAPAPAPAGQQQGAPQQQGSLVDQYAADQQSLIDQQLSQALAAIGEQFSTLYGDLQRQQDQGLGQIGAAHQDSVGALADINDTAVARQATNVADQQAYAAQGSQMLGADANGIMAALQASGVDTTALQGRLATQQGFAQQQATIQGDLLANLGSVAATGREQNSALSDLIQQGAQGDLANNAAMLQAQLAVQQSQQTADANSTAAQASLSVNQSVLDMKLKQEQARRQAAAAAARSASSSSSKAAKNQRMVDAMIATGMSPTEAQLRVDSGTVDNWINDLSTEQRKAVEAAQADAQLSAEQTAQVDAMIAAGVDPTMAQIAVTTGTVSSTLKDAMTPSEFNWRDLYGQDPSAALADIIASGEPNGPTMSEKQRIAARETIASVSSIGRQASQAGQGIAGMLDKFKTTVPGGGDAALPWWLTTPPAKQTKTKKATGPAWFQQPFG